MTLEMAATAGERPAVGLGERSLSAAKLLLLARRAAVRFRGAPAVLYRAPNHLAYPVALFGCALAGVPFVPLNYRLGEDQLTEIEGRHPDAVRIGPDELEGLLDDAGDPPADDVQAPWDQDAVAVILYTSGTTAAPKAALLRHRHLLAYVLNTLEFNSAAEGDAALVAVPPYHIAGLTNLMSNLYTGRRVVYLPAFTADDWLATVRREKVTHAMLVPTMLARIVEEIPEDAAADVPTLRSLAYGGARAPRSVVEKALRTFPDTAFVNAYGLTETSSSIAVLGPEDHRAALAASEPADRDRLTSVGRPLPGVEIELRTAGGELTPPGSVGLVHVRGEQISGEYRGRSVLDADGWFPTGDLGRLDADGYLYVEGRADDTIIRGGENIAPAEIEDVLLTHPGVREAVVIGVPDEEWGQRIVAVLVGSGENVEPEEVRRWAKSRLRTSRTPDTVVFRSDLPRTGTGKLLRRTLIAEITEAVDPAHAAEAAEPDHPLDNPEKSHA
ncbi:fatty acid--CoA ligase family protein [Streptomyces sp. NBC_01016]|uniref:class I adenylate-forming enzyme family protein n=1 Tax=Streptomyces sp. NBC_01016 TaxID=2903720 RepID=UPI002256DBA7|nr:fatty acid--CoA ligase family protein [Streptomyces sp. NBC_01016]MCX4831300.1 fatty acid--CoA ligase family protein [Streptomyces sp. NBC_01016]